MWQDGERRDTLPPWCDTPAAPLYAVGDAIASGDNSRGTVAAVDAATGTMEVKWSDGDSAITYPIDATYLRKVLPWE